jgi:hypothetical protein
MQGDPLENGGRDRDGEEHTPGMAVGHGGAEAKREKLAGGDGNTERKRLFGQRGYPRKLRNELTTAGRRRGRDGEKEPALRDLRG